jgi:teichuronic acid biosynthesis glycosyltransferase TuaC
MKVLVMTSIYPTPADPALGSFVRTQVEALKQAGVEIELLVLSGRFRKLNYPMAVFQLRRRLAEGSIDLVHAHYGYVGMVARTQWKVPVVVTYHGGDLMGLIVNDRGDKARSGPLIAAAGRMLARHVDAAIVQSAEMARLLDSSNVFIIPHEIDFEVFRLADRGEARAALGLEADKKYVLFAANPQNGVKRFPLAKAATGELIRQDPSIELVVAYKETQDRLALYMNACDALVFTSFMEGSPNIVKQAMACNLPIVSTDVGDVREIIGSTEGCYVCKPDVGEFAARLADILRRRERTRGREKVQHLTGLAVSQRITKVYEQVLKNRHMHAVDRTTTNAKPQTNVLDGK